MTIRRLVKCGVFGVCLVAAAPAIVLAWVERVAFKTAIVFSTFAEAAALLPGILGVYVRAAYYYGTLDACSWEVHIGFGSVFTHRGARLERNVSMGKYCVIGHAIFGANVRLASRVSIPSGKRQHVTEGGALGAQTTFDNVKIGTGTWVGEAATILADVGNDCIVAAGAVVVHAVPDRSVVGGNPARVLKAVAPNEG